MLKTLKLLLRLILNAKKTTNIAHLHITFSLEFIK